MKKVLVVILAVQIIFLTACSIPFFGSSDKTEGIGEDGGMVKLSDGDQPNGGEIDVLGSGGELPDAPANSMEQSAQSQTGVAGTYTGAQLPGGSDAENGEPPASSIKGQSGFAGEYSGSPDKGSLPSSSASTGQNMQGKYPVTVYYQDKDGCLIPMTRWIQMQQGVARAAVSLCIDSSITREEIAYYGIYPVLPEGTKILGIDLRDGIATIDFNRALLNYDSAVSERNIISSLIYTMTEFDTIDKVRILVNGYTQGLLKYGTDISEALGRESININTDEFFAETGFGKLDVYLLKSMDEGFTYLVPVSVDEPDFYGELPENLVEQLLFKEAKGGLYSEIPEDVALLDSNTEYGVLTLNFSSELLNYGGNAREEGILKQLIYTARQLEGIKRLRILVEGRKPELPEGTDISTGLGIPAVINDVISS